MSKNKKTYIYIYILLYNIYFYIYYICIYSLSSLFLLFQPILILPVSKFSISFIVYDLLRLER